MKDKSSTKKTNSSQKEVLIIDDDLHSNMLFEELIADHQIHIQSVLSGDQAIMQINKKNDYDLIILDIKLPKMNGIEILEWLRSEEIKTPVIVCTAYASEDMQKQCMKAGADEYITKPLEIDHFRKTVNKYIPLE